MQENNVAKILRIIGKAIIVAGICLAFVISVVSAFTSVDGFTTAISFVAILLSSVISGTLFIGFAEVINLLQLNVFKTEKLIKTLENKE